jgi:hypothetical protein
MMRTPLLLYGMAFAAFAACAPRQPTLEQASPPPPVTYVQTPVAGPETGSPLLAVLVEIGRLSALPVADQKAEVVRLNDSLTRTGLPSDRLRLALLLVLGDTPVRDDERAKGLLAGVAWDDLAYEAVARLALELVDERRRHARDRLDANTSLEEERALREELEARLRAVEQIETDMNNREVEGDASQAEDPLR